MDSDSFEAVKVKYLLEFTRTVKNITNEIRRVVGQKFSETEVPGDGTNVDCSSELKTLLEENKALSEEVEKKEREIALSQSKMQRLIEDKKLLKAETKNTYEALLMARKYYKKYMEIYCTVESSTDKGHSIFIQYFTEAKKETDMFSARFYKDITSGKYEYSRSRPSESDVCIKKMDLILVLKCEKFYKQSSSLCVERLMKYILDNYCEYKQSKDSVNKIKSVLKVFVSKFLQKWKKSNWKMDRFMKNNSKWLDNDILLPKTIEVNKVVNVPKAKGRPTKSFEESSSKTRRRTVKPIVTKTSPEVLITAAQASLIQSGKRTAAKVVKLALTTSPRRFKRMKKIHDTPKCSTMKPYSPEEALALIIDSDMGKEDYIYLQRGAKARGANIYPPYNVIADTKKHCYPHNITVTENEVHIPVQDVLDHTIQRLASVQQDVLLQHHDHSKNKPIKVIYKWGLDGSGGHSIYKQCFTNNSMYTDSNIILCTIVPLQMYEVTTKGKLILWHNPSPSSTRYSRIIRLGIEKETKESVKRHYKAIEEQISSMQPTKVILGNKSYTFKHHAVCTMIDGKTCNVLTETSSSQSCNVCKSTPKDLNNIDLLLKRQYPTSSTFKFGISILHSYLRCYEYLLHISYKMKLNKWQARGQEAKDFVEKEKKEITTKFYHEMGLVVDQAQQGGGNSNDGNTARKFFAEPMKSAAITGLDPNIIIRFSNILSVLSCGFSVHIVIFKNYCIETARLCIQLYSWYKMSASVHKLLLHGADIIKALPLPVGLFSEDVLEASQKEYKSVRLFHARKTSRLDTNTDIVHWMLIASDPVIASKRRSHNKKKKSYNKEVLEMLNVCLVENDDNDEELVDDDDDETDIDD